ncbi:MAG: hypothetical protein ACJAWY_000620 [Sphingomonas echinoides]|jgi:hypothetical protein
MKRFKTALFLATVASCAIISSGAQAQITASNDGELKLHGTGATSIQNVLVQELNCVGGSEPLGVIGSTTAAGTTTTVAEPTNLSTPAGTFDCSTQALNTGFAARYVASGSGQGRSAWDAVGAVSATPAFTHTGTQANPNPFGDWSTVQFAFADNAPTLTEIATFTGNTAGLTGPSAAAGGAPVVFPKFVLPVAVAYAPVYGHNNSTNQDYAFHIDTTGGSPTTINGNAVGGLRLSRTTFCGIFAGTITNYNNSNFTTDNNGTSLRDPNDDSSRWNSDGVPVRLVGRLDRSGTTDIFTRVVAAQCGGAYTQHAETLPYIKASSGQPDFTSARPDTGLRFLGSDTNASNNTVNLVSNQYYNRSTGTYVTVNDASGAAAGTAAYPNPNSTPVTNGTGVFLVANGSGAVAAAINKAPDWRSASWFSAASSTNNVDLNGKIGYIGADFLNGSPTGAGLFAAALKNNTSGAWVLPSAANATVAFGTIAPPQSDASGVYTTSPADTRSVSIPGYLNGGTDTTGAATRNNPLAWYQVLYIGTGLADPSVGYPITGTTQFLGYSCYKADDHGSNRDAIRHMLGWNTGRETNDSNGDDRTGIFTDGTNGLLARSNIGALPSNWQTAINETFLSNDSGLDLNIQAGGADGKCSAATGV